MNEKTFWHIISLLDWSAADDNTIVAGAVDELSRMPADDIFRFQDILSEKLYALDGVAYAQHIGAGSYRKGSYFSPDVFLYVRCCVVANGLATYNQVLADPTQMPKDIDFEPLLYIASRAYRKKMRSSHFPHTTRVSYETFSNTKAWALAEPTYLSKLMSA